MGASKLKDDHIRWILEMDAKGVQSALTEVSSETSNLAATNKVLQDELKETEKWMKEAERALLKFGERNKENAAEYDKAHNAYQQLAEDHKNISKQIEDNNKKIDSNRKKYQELEKTLRVEDMTMNQLKKRAKELQSQLDKTSQSASPAAYNQLKSELTQVQSRMKELKNGAVQLDNSLKNIVTGSLMVMVGNLLTKAVDLMGDLVQKAIEFGFQSIEVAKNAESIVAAFRKLDNSRKLMDDLKHSTSGTIGELELMKKTLKSQEYGIPLEELGNIFEYARRQASIFETDVDSMTTSILDSISRKSNIMLSRLGITTARIKSETAKTGSYMQAVIKIINEELEKQGDVALTAADKGAQAAAKWENAKLNLGKRLVWVGELWDRISGQMADKINELAGDTRSLTDRFTDQIEKIADLETKADDLVWEYEELKSKTSLNEAEHARLHTIMKTLSDSFPGIITQWDEYGNIISINTDKIWDFIEAEKARLKYVHKDALEELNTDLEKNLKKKAELEEKYQKGYWEENITNRSIGDIETIQHFYTPEQKAEMERQIKELGDDIKGGTAEIERLSGESIGRLVSEQKRIIEKRKEFNQMDKEQLDNWIKNTQNANSEYLKLAEQIYQQRFGKEYKEPDKTSKVDHELIRQRKEVYLIEQTLLSTHNEKMADIRQRYLDGNIKTEAQYNRELFAQQQAYSLLREKALEEYIGRTDKKELKTELQRKLTEQQNKRLEQEVKFRAELEKVILNADPMKKEEHEYRQRLSRAGINERSIAALKLAIGAEEDEKLRVQLEQQLEAFIVLEQQHIQNVDRIRRQQKSQKERDFELNYKERRAELQLEIQQEEAFINAQAELGQLSGEALTEAQAALQQKRLDAINEEIEARNAAGLSYEKLMLEQQKAETNLTKTYIDEFKRRAELYSGFATQIGDVLGNALVGNEDALRSSLLNIVNMALDVLKAQVQMSIASATVQSLAQPDSIATFGAAGLARAAVITALIEGAFAAAKTVIAGIFPGSKTSSSSGSSTTSGKRVLNDGFAEGGFNDAGTTGGYTGQGDTYDVRGAFANGQPYHAGEYIVPQKVLANPTIVPLVRQIESVRKTVYSTKNPLPAGFAEGGYNMPDNNTTSGIYTDTRLMEKVSSLLEYLASNKIKVDFNYQEFENIQERMETSRKKASKR